MTAADFPAGTKFFVKGADVPVAVLPTGSASSWYGGTPTHWDTAHLTFARRESQQRFVEVPYAEFARLVDESIPESLSAAERESLVAKLVASGLYDKDDIAELSELPDAELEMEAELVLNPRESVLDPDTGHMDSDDLAEAMGRKLSNTMTASDFPAGTRFFKIFNGLPVAASAEGEAFSWYGGSPTKWDEARWTLVELYSNGLLYGVPYAQFATTVADSEGKTVEDREKLEAEAEAMLKESRAEVEAKAERFRLYSKPLSIEEQASLDAKISVLQTKWQIASASSIFPLGTKFFIKGIDVPVAVLPDDKAASFYGGTPTHWDNDHLVFARSDSKETFDEVPFEVFVRVVAESVGSTVDKAKLFEDEIAPLLEKLKADREFALRRPAVGADDFMYCRPDKYGVWRDSDGDPI